MKRTESLEYSRPLIAKKAFRVRWYGRLTLLLLGTLFLTLGFAPVNQFYLGWIGLVPWLVVLHTTRSQRSAFFWSWIGGTLFFIANMWWMAKVTVPGMIALMAILGLYWGVAGAIVRGAGLLPPATDETNRHISTWISLGRCLLIATVWVAVGESLRGTWPWNGLPWLYLGYTQSAVLPVCQVADITGVLGVSFVVALVNAWIALWALNDWKIRGLGKSGIVIAAVFVFNVAYGFYRMRNETLAAGPKVLVVQPNYPQDNATGAKGGTAEEMIDFHFGQTLKVLEALRDVDLVVWSETMMPPLNAESQTPLHDTNMAPLIEETKRGLTLVASKYSTGILTGGEWGDSYKESERRVDAENKRNAAYFVDRQGRLSDSVYHKIHLVPFGEFIPFRESFPPLYRLMISLGPPDMASYALQPGSESNLTVFPLATKDGTPSWRFVTPICFEDIDPGLCAKMIRPTEAGRDVKRADFLVNITNDGWFLANENPQHLQAAIFRSIENRVPTARSVNTGISGFIDPLGQTSGLIRARTAGTSTGVLMLDARVTLFTRWGQWFAWLCWAITTIVLVTSVRRRYRSKVDAKKE